MTGDGYSLSGVSKLLGLSRSIVTGLIDAGFVAPSRGRKNEYRFTFRDLVMLRAARGLSEAGLSSVRILRSLRRLKEQLPEDRPLIGLRIEAVGDAVVVSESGSQWQPHDGQLVLGFTIAANAGQVSFIDTTAPVGPEAVPSASEFFARGVLLEETSKSEACAAYRTAIESDVTYCAAYNNLGRLLHENGDLAQAEATYRQGIARCPAEGVLRFNLGVLLEDADRRLEAATAYREALKSSPDMADAHYNLALLCEAAGLHREAVRHLSAFRKHSQ